MLSDPTPPEPKSGSSLRVRSTGIERTRQAAAAVAAILRSGEVVLLNGDLGAGKTAFTQGVAEALGVDDHVTSPTFAIMNTYECGPAVFTQTLVHIDAYRLGGSEGIDQLGVDELLRDGAVAFIEWGELVRDLFIDAPTITFSWVNDDERELVFTGFPDSLVSELQRVGLEPCS